MYIIPQVKEILKKVRFNQDNWYITLTLRHKSTNEELLRFLNSQIPSLLESSGVQHHLRYQSKDIISVIYDFARQQLFTHTDNNLMFSIHFSLSTIRRSRKNAVSDLLKCLAFPLRRDCKQTAYIAHIPDLTSAINCMEKVKPSVVLFITPESAQSLLLVNKKITQKKSVQNQFMQPTHNRYYQRVTQDQNTAVRHGTGAEKKSRTFDSGISLFIKQQIESIKSSIEEDSHLHTIQIILSPGLHEYTEQASKLAKRLYPNQEVFVEVMSAQNQIEKQENLQNLITDTIHKKTNDFPSPLLPNMVNSTHTVSSMLRKAQVDTLYLRKEYSKSGFVLPSGVTFSYPVKNSKKVANIRPWLIKGAIETDADIKVIEKSTQNQPHQIMASLRFSNNSGIK